MLQDARTNKVDKATTVVITIMPTTRRTTVATATTAPAGVAPEVEDASVLEPDIPEVDVPEVDTDTDAESENGTSTNFFDQFASDEDSVEKSREEIISELVKKPNVKKLVGLHIKNVVTNTTKDVPFLTFVLKEFIIGDTRSATTDAFGVPEVVLGRTHNAVVSAYAVSAVMKDSPKTAMFATRVAEGADVANVLFAGGTMDILMEYVSAGEAYVNPFGRATTPTVFERDHVLVHVIGLTMGEVGRDAYAAMLARI